MTIEKYEPALCAEDRATFLCEEQGIGEVAGTYIALAIREAEAASYRAGAEDMRERAAELLERNDMNSAGYMAAEVRSLPLPDPQPTPTQESRDV